MIVKWFMVVGPYGLETVGLPAPNGGFRALKRLMVDLFGKEYRKAKLTLHHRGKG